MIIKIEKLPKTSANLSADAMHRTLKATFSRILDSRRRPTISLPDALLAGFAMFSLKDSSLLAFDERRHERNLKVLYGIDVVPADTTLREALDPVSTESLRASFNDIFRCLQRGKVLEAFAFHEGAYLLARDGTTYFSSKDVHCDSCLCATNSHTGVVTYTHQMLAASIVHPDHREVIPLAPEPIIKQDGSTKNDCERNAARRFLAKIRNEHPHLKLIVIEDGLASNAPHIDDLISHRMSYILGAKPGDHVYLFEQYVKACDAGEVTVITKDLAKKVESLSFRSHRTCP